MEISRLIVGGLEFSCDDELDVENDINYVRRLFIFWHGVVKLCEHDKHMGHLAVKVVQEALRFISVWDFEALIFTVG